MLLLKEVIGTNEGTRLLEQIIEYIFSTDDNVTVNDVRRSTRREISEREEDITMTIAEKLRKEGMQEGKQEGKQEGECTVLQRQLENRFGKLSQHHRERLEKADSETLLKWSERVLTAQSIEEVFAEE